MIDASVMLALVLDEPHTGTVADMMGRWVADGTELHAPLLAQYEVASALTRKRVRDGLSREEADEALAIIEGLDVTFDLVPDNARAIEIAVELNATRPTTPSTWPWPSGSAPRYGPLTGRLPATRAVVTRSC